MITVDGNKLLEKLGIPQDELTAERVSERMLELGTGELTNIILECQIGDKPTVVIVGCSSGAGRSILEQSILSGDIMSTPQVLVNDDIGVGMSWLNKAMLIEEKQFAMTDALSPEEIKRKLKYCKNPMEKIQLQRELTEAYKDRKRGWV